VNDMVCAGLLLTAAAPITFDSMLCPVSLSGRFQKKHVDMILFNIHQQPWMNLNEEKNAIRNFTGSNLLSN
jgi:hypothetical protein